MKNNDLMTVEYTELDNGCPALCFCSDLISPITNKTLAKSFCNFIDNDLKFKIVGLKLQKVMLTFVEPDLIEIQGKIDKTYYLMGYANINDLYRAMKQVVNTLETRNEN